MKVGIDTNVLISVHIASLERHNSARRYVLDLLDAEDDIMVVTPLILHEFIHVITDARRFSPPVSMGEALALARLYLNRTNVECIAADGEALALALDLLERHGLGRKRIADTLLAATMITKGVKRLVTCNAGDFAIFEQLEVIDLQ